MTSKATRHRKMVGNMKVSNPREHEKKNTNGEASTSKYLHGPLPFVEICFYWAVWISMVGYMMYCVITASNFYKEELYPGDFNRGWKIIGRDKDVCDTEWEFWLAMKVVLLVAYILHSFGTVIISHFIPKFRAWFSPIFTFCFLASILGVLPVLFLISHCLVMYLSARTRSVALVWGSALALLSSLQFDTIKQWQFKYLTNVNEHKDLVLFVALMSLLRCISFSLECCWQPTDEDSSSSQDDVPSPTYTLIDLLLYNFYLPLFANGPVMTYRDFYKQFYQPVRSLSKQEILTIVWDLIRIIWWYIFLEVYLHYVYSAALLREGPVFMKLSAWTTSGIMYSQLHIFLTKYVVLYRFSAVFARVDHVDPPGVPRCVSTLYLFGDMWRYFDRGLYFWMKKYIYVPVGGSHRGIIRQLLGSLLAFSFVWAWHGGHVDTMWWFIPNWLGVAAEGMTRLLVQLPDFKRREAQLSVAMSRRIRAVFGTLSCSCLILSNLVFLQGAEPVWYYISSICYRGFPIALFTTLSGIYLSVQTNMELNRYREGKW